MQLTSALVLATLAAGIAATPLVSQTDSNVVARAQAPSRALLHKEEHKMFEKGLKSGERKEAHKVAGARHPAARRPRSLDLDSELEVRSHRQGGRHGKHGHKHGHKHHKAAAAASSAPPSEGEATPVSARDFDDLEVRQAPSRGFIRKEEHKMFEKGLKSGERKEAHRPRDFEEDFDVEIRSQPARGGMSGSRMHVMEHKMFEKGLKSGERKEAHGRRPRDLESFDDELEMRSMRPVSPKGGMSGGRMHVMEHKMFEKGLKSGERKAAHRPRDLELRSPVSPGFLRKEEHKMFEKGLKSGEHKEAHRAARPASARRPRDLENDSELEVRSHGQGGRGGRHGKKHGHKHHKAAAAAAPPAEGEAAPVSARDFEDFDVEIRSAPPRGGMRSGSRMHAAEHRMFLKGERKGEHRPRALEDDSELEVRAHGQGSRAGRHGKHGKKHGHKHHKAAAAASSAPPAEGEAAPVSARDFDDLEVRQAPSRGFIRKEEHKMFEKGLKAGEHKAAHRPRDFEEDFDIETRSPFGSLHMAQHNAYEKARTAFADRNANRPRDFEEDSDVEIRSQPARGGMSGSRMHAMEHKMFEKGLKSGEHRAAKAGGRRPRSLEDLD